MITERGGTGNGGSILVITKHRALHLLSYTSVGAILLCGPMGGSLGGASRMINGGRIGGGGGRCPRHRIIE